jgi:hypothetical protein
MDLFFLPKKTHKNAQFATKEQNKLATIIIIIMINKY